MRGVPDNRVTLADRGIMIALVAVAAAIVARPVYSYHAFLVGKACSDARAHALAVRYLERATALSPENERAWSQLGYDLSRLGRTEEAIDAYERALELTPEDIHAATELALIYVDRGAYRTAIATLEPRLPKDRGETMSWILLATCYEKAGDRAGARRVWETIYEEVDPGNVVAKDKLGR